jgi:hypothetical protein
MEHEHDPVRKGNDGAAVDLFDDDFDPVRILDVESSIFSAGDPDRTPADVRIIERKPARERGRESGDLDPLAGRERSDDRIRRPRWESAGRLGRRSER